MNDSSFIKFQSEEFIQHIKLDANKMMNYPTKKPAPLGTGLF